MAGAVPSPEVAESDAPLSDAAPASMMTNAIKLSQCLWLAAYIGTLGIPATPRDYMWAAENPVQGTVASSEDNLPPVLYLPGDMIVPCDPDQNSAVVHFEVSAW